MARLDSASGQISVSANGNIATAGLGFQPKIVLFFDTQYNNVNTFNNNATHFFGYGISSTNRGYTGMRTNNNQTPSDCESYTGDSLCLKAMYGNGVLRFDADFVSLDAAGFTINISNYASAGYIYYLALGGSELDVDAGILTSITGTGTQSVTGVGFEPRGIMFAGSGVSGAMPATRLDALMNYGFADGTNEKSSACFAEDAVNPSNTTRVSRGSYAYCSYNNTGGGSKGILFMLDSMDSDGFTIDIMTNNDGVAQHILWIAFDGTEVLVDEVTLQNAGGNFSFNTATFRPKTGIFNAMGHPVDGSNIADIRQSIGFVDDSGNTYSAGIWDDDNVVATSSQQRNSNTEVYQSISGVATMDAAATFVSWDSNGFTLNQSNPEPIATNEMIFLILGDYIEPVEPGYAEAGGDALAPSYHWYITPDLYESGSTVFAEFVKYTVYESGRYCPGLLGMPEYKLFIQNHDGEVVYVLENWAEAVAIKETNGIGSLAVVPIDPDPLIEILKPDTAVDYYVQLYRRNKSVGLDWYREWEGLYLDYDDYLEDTGDRSFTFYSNSLLDIISRRRIMYPKSDDVFAGAGDDIIKQLVRENAGFLATTANGRLIYGVTPDLTIAADTGSGYAWAGNKNLAWLLDTIKAIGEKTGVFFDVVNNGGYTWLFETYFPSRGEDRRFKNIDATGLNDVGNTPAVFSSRLGNMLKPVETRKFSGSKNVILGVGAGQQNDVLVALQEDYDAVALSPLNYREDIVSISGEGDYDSLLDATAEILEKNKASEEFAFDVAQTKYSYYGKHWGFGDFVTTIDNDGDLHHKMVQKVVLTLTKSKMEEIQATFTKIPLE